MNNTPGWDLDLETRPGAEHSQVLLHVIFLTPPLSSNNNRSARLVSICCMVRITSGHLPNHF